MTPFVRKSVMVEMVSSFACLPEYRRTRFRKYKDAWALYWPNGSAKLSRSPDSDGFDLEVKTRRSSVLSIMSRKAAEEAGVVFYDDL